MRGFVFCFYFDFFDLGSRRGLPDQVPRGEASELKHALFVLGELLYKGKHSVDPRLGIICANGLEVFVRLFAERVEFAFDGLSVGLFGLLFLALLESSRELSFRRNLLLGDRNLVHGLHELEVADVEAGDERDCDAGLARATGSTGAMDIDFG